MSNQVKVTIILPCVDNDGKAFSAFEQLATVKRLTEVVDGATLSAAAYGWYTSKDGKKIGEDVQPIVIICDESKVDELRQYCKTTCKILRQECIYFEVQTDGFTVDFVTAEPDCAE